MDIINLKQEEFIEKQCPNLNLHFFLKPDEVGGHINKLEKKCGEIYICEEDVFNILCIFCETTFEEIQKFFTHIRCDHKYEETCIANVTETDPLEIRNDNDDHEDVKPTVEQIKYENSIFPKNNAFDEHKTQNSGENILMVDKIENKSEIKKKPELKRNSEICNVCPKTFNSKRTLQRHKRREHSEKGTKLNTQSQVETDENNDEEQRKEDAKTFASETDPLKCKYCGRRLADPSILIEHERIHTGERPCQCQICGKQFRTRSCVRRHEKTHSNIRQFKCEKCGMAFKSKVALCAHLLRHGEKKLKCNFCDKLFHSKGAKIEHERIHTGEKPYQCNFCGKCFQTGGHLNMHTRMHTGIRPYKCPYCDECFAAKAILDNHVVIHTDERPFVCTTCNATFPRKKALKSHEKIHSDYRGYVCKICGEAFKQYPTLHGHMKSHKRLFGKFKKLQS